MMKADQFQIVHARAAGLDVHKMEITATVLLCSPHGGAAQASTRAFGKMPKGLSELLGSHRVTAAVCQYQTNSLQSEGLTNSICSGACIIRLGIEGGPRAYEKPKRGMHDTFNEGSRIEH